MDYLGIAYIVIGLLGTLGNGLSCVVILSHKPLRRRLANYFIINQAFMDLLIGVILLLNTAAGLESLQFAGAADKIYCYVWQSRLVVLGLLVSSILSIVAVSVERYVEVAHPIRHRVSIGQNVVLAGLAVVWIAGVLFKASSLLPFVRFANGTCFLGAFPSIRVSTFVVVYNFLGEYFLPICVISFCYVHMWQALRSKPNAIIRQVAIIRNSASSNKTLRARRNIFKTLLTVVLCFLMTWTFKQLLSLANGFGLITVDWNGPLYKFSVILQFSKCCVNPFIYLFQYEEFQRGLTRLVKRRNLNRVAPGSVVQVTQV